MSNETAKIRNTGELREFLVNTLGKIESGEIEEGKARSIAKMAAQVHESFYSEIKIAKIKMEAGHAMTELGKLPINQ